MQCLIPSQHMKFNKCSQCDDEDEDGDDNGCDDHDSIKKLSLL